MTSKKENKWQYAGTDVANESREIRSQVKSAYVRTIYPQKFDHPYVGDYQWKLFCTNSKILSYLYHYYHIIHVCRVYIVNNYAQIEYILSTVVTLQQKLFDRFVSL